MTQVRETIEYLCNIIVYHGCRGVSAETFRQAKFNKHEATATMWSVLFHLLRVVEDKHLSEPLIAVDEYKTCNIVRLCKHEMYYKGYRATGFFGLPDDMTAGSREILLAVGWLLAEEKVVDTLIGEVKPILTEDPVTLDPTGVLAGINTEALRLPRFRKSDGCRLLQQNLNYLTWLNGKLIAVQRRLLSVMLEYATVLSKVHVATHHSAAPTSRLSLLEVHLLRHRRQLEVFQSHLESTNCYLQSLLLWKEKEALFWKWMSSVLDSKGENKVEQEANCCGTFSGTGYKPNYSLQKAKEQQVELSKLLQCHEHSYRKVSKSWKKLKSSFDSCDKIKELQIGLKESPDLSVSQLESEVFAAMQASFLSSELKEKDSARNFDFRGEIKWINHKCTKQQKQANLSSKSTASLEIEKLSIRMDNCRELLEDIRRNHQKDMLVLSEKLHDVVCIPVSNIP